MAVVLDWARVCHPNRSKKFEMAVGTKGYNPFSTIMAF